MRKTKIIATVGPASNDQTVLKQMIQAGVDCFRLNFSHGDHATHQKALRSIRQSAADLNQAVSIMADLQGPKIRLGCLKADSLELKSGEVIVLDVNADPNNGTRDKIFVDYPLIHQDVSIGDSLLLDDGLIELSVRKIEGTRIHCEALTDCILKNRKGINKQGDGLTLSGLTEKDKKDLAFSVSLAVDYIAVSFVKDQSDLHAVRELINHHCHKNRIGIIAKIERAEAIANIDEIIQATDLVMIARGDLGVALGYAQVPALQKMIIERARAFQKVVITATQMMASMEHSPIPTRAEVSDVANAILDGTDAVMLSGETASGAHPIRVIEAMDHICFETESQPYSTCSKHLNDNFERMDEAIAMAAMYTATHLEIKAIICLTESGFTPLWMSRVHAEIPIYGLTRHTDSMRMMNLYRGVYPISFDPTIVDRVHLNRAAIDHLLALGKIKTGDRVILTKGDFVGTSGGTNSLKLLVV